MAELRNPAAAPTPQDEMLEALVSVTAENTTTLIDVQRQAAATAASVKDARTYMATVVKNTDWETNGKKIAAILDKALLRIAPPCMPSVRPHARCAGHPSKSPTGPETPLWRRRTPAKPSTAPQSGS